MIDNVADVETEKLYEYYANACATYYGAMGHTKALYNEVNLKRYAAELELRGENVPATNIASKFGGFNGEGSY